MEMRMNFPDEFIHFHAKCMNLILTYSQFSTYRLYSSSWRKGHTTFNQYIDLYGFFWYTINRNTAKTNSSVCSPPNCGKVEMYELLTEMYLTSNLLHFTHYKRFGNVPRQITNSYGDMNFEYNTIWCVCVFVCHLNICFLSKFVYMTLFNTRQNV